MSPQQRREQLIDAALGVILERGYEGVSIEAIARAAGVTRPVVYDHFPNLGRLLQALIEREERYALAQLEDILPEQPGRRDPAELIATSMRRFLDAVASRPSTWQIILSHQRGLLRSCATMSRQIGLGRSAESSDSSAGRSSVRS